MSERELNLQIFKEFNIEEENKLDEIINNYISHLANILKETEIIILPKVEELLTKLKEENQLGVVTGNGKQIGETILEKTNLKRFFSIFSYGDNVNKREEIVENAIKQADNIDKIIVIGDSPADIEAGKAEKAFTVAVASGHYKKEQLKDADLVLESLDEYNKILEIK